ncbi:carbohydrate kinase family protein [Actinoplanes xinjiangensis]|uniref:Adenosine kinase n=1 Tax=Actinoplanes xinjiangensis TaxID=512350 RepID=A0A316ETR6_9ACTN|nr:carbohydrate kinase family protein [Actinoplanes xinjiangensis]PWK36034.1 adenosine kinase [Actinoplanes xinjiangensis]GIF42967.1 adenosine kinase [Actinoplanes xinjiangensis]
MTDHIGPVLITGSIATDHLMTFPGRFADQLIAEKLDQVSLSFLVDDLTVRDGGVAANIAYGMARLGGRPLLVGAAGADFDDGYRNRLELSGVCTEHVHISTTQHTARFVCTTDLDNCQIASFYAGAMGEAASIDLDVIGTAVGNPRLVLVGPDQPEAMIRHTDTCRRRGWTFAADPSQQLARMNAAQLLDFITGAAFLFSNAYEFELLLAKTGLSTADVVHRTATVVTTMGSSGVRIADRTGSTTIPAHPVSAVVDPTGAGDAFRAGFLTAVLHGATPADAATLGCRLAALVLRSHGTQEYDSLDLQLPPSSHQARGWTRSLGTAS